MKACILILTKAILIVLLGLVVSYCVNTFAPLWVQLVFYGVGYISLIWGITYVLNGNRNIFQRQGGNGWVLDRSSKGYGVLYTGTATRPETKEVTLKVNGNLCIKNVCIGDCNFDGLPSESIAFVSEMKCYPEKIKLKNLTLDKDTELFGDVFVKTLFIPHGMSYRILCAGNITFLKQGDK